jgi:predicted DNA-binding protein
VNTMYSVIIDALRMTEKRQGQDLVRLYLPVELKERFKLYCQLKGATMTEVIKEQIEELLANTEMTDLLQQRLSGERDHEGDRTSDSPTETAPPPATKAKRGKGSKEAS